MHLKAILHFGQDLSSTEFPQWLSTLSNRRLSVSIRERERGKDREAEREEKIPTLAERLCKKIARARLLAANPPLALVLLLLLLCGGEGRRD